MDLNSGLHDYLMNHLMDPISVNLNLQPKTLLTNPPCSPGPETVYLKTLITLKRSKYIFKASKNYPVWNHRSSTPPGSLPHYLNTTIPNDINGALGTADHNDAKATCYFLLFLSYLSIRLLPRCPSDLLQHWSCPHAHN